MFDKKAQGAIEYLLIIGAAILVVAVVIVAITGVLGTGKTNATTQSTDSAYTGLRDILDLGKGKTILYLQLKAGDNEIIFQTNFANNTIGEVFKNLPIYSVIQFEGSPNCGVVDANKKQTLWEPRNSFPTYYGNNSDAKDCNIISLKKIKIIVPEDVNLDVGEETNQEIILFNADGNPDSIENCYDLQEMRQDLSRSYYLVDHIDCSMTKDWNGGKGFEPIGKYHPSNSLPFTGNFDGKGKKISNLTINRPEENNVGLFSLVNAKNVDSISIKDLTLEDINFMGSRYVGGLIGNSEGRTNRNIIVENIFVSGVVNGSGIYVGGIIGSSYGTEIKKVKMSGEVIGSNNLVGGLVGVLNSSRIQYSSNLAKVHSVNSENIGGLAGKTNTGFIEYSYSEGDVSGDKNVGGLVGSQTVGRMINSYSLGEVSFNNYGGGLVGYWDSGNVHYSYFAGEIGAVSGVSGIIGRKPKDKNVFNSFWDINKSGIKNSLDINGVGMGLYTHEMKNKLNYHDLNESKKDENWDFDIIWAINPSINDGYPYLINNLPN